MEKNSTEKMMDLFSTNSEAKRPNKNEEIHFRISPRIDQAKRTKQLLVISIKYYEQFLHTPPYINGIRFEVQPLDRPHFIKGKYDET